MLNGIAPYLFGDYAKTSVFSVSGFPFFYFPVKCFARITFNDILLHSSFFCRVGLKLYVVLWMCTNHLSIVVTAGIEVVVTHARTYFFRCLLFWPQLPKRPWDSFISPFFKNLLLLVSISDLPCLSSAVISWSAISVIFLKRKLVFKAHFLFTRYDLCPLCGMFENLLPNNKNLKN